MDAKALFVLLIVSALVYAQEEKDIGMANPAAVYCNDLGYNYKIVKDSSGGEYGVCAFPGGTECDDWSFLQGKCGKEFSYCAKQGYGIKTLDDGNDPFTPEYAVCTSDKGEVIGSVSKLYNLLEKSTVATRESPEVAGTEPPGQITEMDLPSFFDWRDYPTNSGQNWMTPVKDQGSCGSCWAFSVVGVVEAVHNIRENTPNRELDLSEEYLVSDCYSGGSCSGGWPEYAMEFIRDNGTPDEGCMPYTASDSVCSNRCADWMDRLATIDYAGQASLQDLKQKLIEKGPISVLLSINAGYWFNGMYKCWTSEVAFANHVVVLIGYNDSGR
ncbi:MAG: DUF333 domain-containing protein, partial [Candidatus Micrarchaeota archaeon]|nr:DUF333 domain-containing protein [Candidatus Micrarchaeota archaeon]